MNTEKIERIEKAIQDQEEWYVEYRETHHDEGQSILDNLFRDSFGSNVHRLESWLVEIGIEKPPQGFLDHLGEWNCLYEAVSGSIFGSPNNEAFTLDRYPLDEIETQIEKETICESAGVTRHDLEAYLETQDEFCIPDNRVDRDCFETYTPSDAVWYILLTRETALESWNEYKEGIEENED